MFNFIHVSPSSGLSDISDADLGLFIGGMLTKQSDLGLAIENKSAWTPISIGRLDGQAIDFTGTGGTLINQWKVKLLVSAPLQDIFFWHLPLLTHHPTWNGGKIKGRMFFISSSIQ